MSGSEGFKDHFSGQAAAYTKYRPSYPAELFSWLAVLTKRHERAWDCGCGNGQAAHGLVPHYRLIIATDPSATQIEHALPHERIDYGIAPAEDSGIESGSIDLVVVAQALHWFDFGRFYDEVRRVAAPGGVLAAVTYGELRLGGEIDPLIDRFYFDVVGPYWPPERRYVDERYSTIPFPFPEIEAPEFRMEAHWSLEHLVGYLGTWSAVKEYVKEQGTDPLEALQEELRPLWGDPAALRKVTWPLTVRAGRVRPEEE